MKTVIVYTSAHHGNTKKLVDAIAAEYGIETIDAMKNKEADLTGYDCIGIASGIAYSKYYPQMIEFIEENLPENKKVFFMHTAASPRENHASDVKAITDERGCESLGTYFCKGFNTYGPFKLIGGIGKGHPTADECNAAVAFFGEMIRRQGNENVLENHYKNNRDNERTWRDTEMGAG